MKEGSPGLKVKDEVTSQDSQADSQEEEEEDAESSVGMVQTPGGLPSSNPVHNLWSEDKNHAQLPDLIHDKPFVSDAFKQVSDKTARVGSFILIVSSSTIDKIFEFYTFYENRYEIYTFTKIGTKFAFLRKFRT